MEWKRLQFFYMNEIQLGGENKYFNKGKIHIKPNALMRQIKQILEKAAKARQNILQQDTGVKHIWLWKAVMACLRSEERATFIHLGHLMYLLSPLAWLQLRAHFSNCGLWSTCWWEMSTEMVGTSQRLFLALTSIIAYAEQRVIEQAFFRYLTQRK